MAEKVLFVSDRQVDIAIETTPIFYRLHLDLAKFIFLLAIQLADVD